LGLLGFLGVGVGGMEQEHSTFQNTADADYTNWCQLLARFGDSTLSVLQSAAAEPNCANLPTHAAVQQGKLGQTIK
jgi:hypothetical protein